MMWEPDPILGCMFVIMLILSLAVFWEFIISLL